MAQIPAPIPDRLDEVGGIESMTVDGHRCYFGFCYSMDIAVSPLIDDPEVMAAFASQHMVQRDGAHDVEFCASWSTCPWTPPIWWRGLRPQLRQRRPGR